MSKNDWLVELTRDANNLAALITGIERDLIIIRRTKNVTLLDKILTDGFRLLDNLFIAPAKQASKMVLSSASDNDLLRDIADAAALFSSIEKQLLEVRKDLNFSRIDTILEGLDLVRIKMGIPQTH